MNAFPIGLALMAVIISPITTLGLASEIYTYGTQFFVYILGFIIAIPLIGYFYIPVFYKLQATSMYMVRVNNSTKKNQHNILCLANSRIFKFLNVFKYCIFLLNLKYFVIYLMFIQNILNFTLLKGF